MSTEEKKSLLTRIVERKPPVYWWVLLNVSMTCVAVVSWFYFVPTFNYPEVSQNYERIIKLGRTPSLPAFEAIDAPNGKTLSPVAAHRMFASPELTQNDIKELNATFLRNYIQNIKLKKFNFYTKGSFKVLSTRPLGASDLFQEGIVVHAQAMRTVGPDDRKVPFLVEIELILPGVTTEIQEYFPVHTQIDLYKVPHYASILNVERKLADDGETIVYLSIVPLTNSPAQRFKKNIEFKVSTPTRIFPEYPLPILKENQPN